MEREEKKIKKVIKYECDYCKDLFDSEEHCLEHEDRHKRIEKANQMLKNGHTLKQIQEECKIWHNLPDYLESVNKDNCFVANSWRCCDKPAHRITYINMDGSVRLWDYGSWSGCYGSVEGW